MLNFEQKQIDANKENKEIGEISGGEEAKESLFKNAKSLLDKINSFLFKFKNSKQELENIEKDFNFSYEDVENLRKEIFIDSELQDLDDEADMVAKLGRQRIYDIMTRLSSRDKMTEEERQKLLEDEYQAGTPEYDDISKVKKMYYTSVGNKKKYSNIYSIMRSGLENEQREVKKTIIQEAQKKRNNILEKNGLFQLSKEDFNNYFLAEGGDAKNKLEQGNTGTCFIVAAIHALSCSPNFELLCRSSMKRLADGSWEVKIPLLDENGETVIITPEETKPQKNEQFLKRKKGKIIPDTRTKLEPLKGREGMRVLEAAFIKSQFQEVNRLKVDKGGYSGETLLTLGGNNFEEYGFDPDEENLDSIDELRMSFLDNFLENFDKELFIATTSTKKNFYIKDISTKRKEEIFGHHAYSVSNVDSKNKIIFLTNPHDTSKPIRMTFEQFKKNFSHFRAVRINYSKLLGNLQSIEKSF